MSQPSWSVYPRVEKVILTTVCRGEGKDHSDPCRTVVQVHHQDGEFIAEFDPLLNMERLRGRLIRAEALLRAAPPLGTEDAKWRERVDDFFDPEPLG